MRLELFELYRRWPRQRTQRDDERGSVNSGILLLLHSVQFVGLILPSNFHAEIWTRLHASAISSDIWGSGCVTSANFGMACVIVIERKYLSCSSQVTLFRCITFFYGTVRIFTLSHIVSQAVFYKSVQVKSSVCAKAFVWEQGLLKNKPFF